MTKPYAFRRLDDGSRMSREAHVRFCEGPRVKSLRSTHPYLRLARGFVYLVAEGRRCGEGCRCRWATLP